MENESYQQCFIFEPPGGVKNQKKANQALIGFWIFEPPGGIKNPKKATQALIGRLFDLDVLNQVGLDWQTVCSGRPNQDLQKYEVYWTNFLPTGLTNILTYDPIFFHMLSIYATCDITVIIVIIGILPE